MTIAEWVNESPGRMIVIKPVGGWGEEFERPGFVRFMARSRCLGKTVSCHVDVCGDLLDDADAAGSFVVEEIKRATECLIHSIKDRN